MESTTATLLAHGTHALVDEAVVMTQFAAGELFDVGTPLTLDLSGFLLVFSCCSFVCWSHIALATILYPQLQPAIFSNSGGMLSYLMHE